MAGLDQKSAEILHVVFKGRVSFWDLGCEVLMCEFSVTVEKKSQPEGHNYLGNAANCSKTEQLLSI